MKRLGLALASIASSRARLLVAATMCAAIALTFGIPRLKFETGQDRLLDPGSKISRDNTRFQSQFGGDPMLILFESSGTSTDIRQLFAAENRATLARVEGDLMATGQYQYIISPLTILQFAQTEIQQRMVSQPAKLAADETAADAAARKESASRGETLAQQDAASIAARQHVDDTFNAEFGADARRFVDVGDQTLDNPKFLEFVLFGADGAIRPELSGIFPDTRHALMIARLRGNLSIDDGSVAAGAATSAIAGYRFSGVSVLVSGPPLLVKEINDKMKSALVVMALFAVAIMVAVLFLIFRARWRLLSLPAVVVGCLSAFGLMGFVGIPLTMVTISGLPILLGLGVDFAIQLHNRIEEETLATNSAEAGIQNTILRLGPALGIAAIAACIGFIVLHLSDVPMIRDFGSMLAVGSIIVFVTAATLISSVLFLRERQRIGPKELPRARIEVERFVGRLTAQTVGRLAPIAVIAAVVAISGLYVSRNIETQTDPEKFVPSDSRVLADLHHVAAVSGSTSEVNLLVEVPPGRHVTDQDVLDWMISFEQREHAAHPELKQSNSLASFVQSVTGAPPTTADVNSVLAIAPQPLIDDVVNADRTSASITFALDDSVTLTGRSDLTSQIEHEAHQPPGVTVSPAGIAVVGTAAVEAVSSNRDLMSFVALIAIFATLLAAFRNPVKAILPLLPVVLALGASAMLLYLGGVQYSPLTSISGPLIIAMGTEFNILLMARYFEERGAGTEPLLAMRHASLRIGRAIAASGLTIMGGFAVLAFSNFPLLDNFGKVTALNIGLSLLSTLILLPPLLVWADADQHFFAIPDGVTE